MDSHGMRPITRHIMRLWLQCQAADRKASRRLAVLSLSISAFLSGQGRKRIPCLLQAGNSLWFVSGTLAIEQGPAINPSCPPHRALYLIRTFCMGFSGQHSQGPYSSGYYHSSVVHTWSPGLFWAASCSGFNQGKGFCLWKDGQGFRVFCRGCRAPPCLWIGPAVINLCPSCENCGFGS